MVLAFFVHLTPSLTLCLYLNLLCYIAHADKITAYIKPPFVDFVFSKVQLGLRNYGATAPIELFLEEEKNQTEQVVLECIKYGCKK